MPTIWTMPGLLRSVPFVHGGEFRSVIESTRRFSDDNAARHTEAGRVTSPAPRLVNVELSPGPGRQQDGVSALARVPRPIRMLQWVDDSERGGLLLEYIGECRREAVYGCQ